MFTEFKFLFQNEINVLSIVATISAISVIISSLEWLFLYKQFRDDGIYSWPIRKSRTKYLLNGFFSHFFNTVFQYPNVLFLIGAKLSFSIVILFSIGNITLLTISSVVIAFSSILLSFRGLSGFSGADQMSKITFTTLSLCLISLSPFVLKIGLLFLSGQLIIAYSTAGWLRIIQPTWRNGSDLLLVIRQHTYGNKLIWEKAREHPAISKYASLTILIFESSILFALFLPLNYFILYLCLGVLFHLLNAIIMGLNTFFWTFLATYPAIIWTCIQLNHYVYKLH